MVEYESKLYLEECFSHDQRAPFLSQTLCPPAALGKEALDSIIMGQFSQLRVMHIGIPTCVDMIR